MCRLLLFFSPTIQEDFAVTISPHTFDSINCPYPDVPDMDPFTLIFPHPMTLGDYKKWYRVLFQKDPDVDNDDVENGELLRLYRAAWAISQREPIPLPDDAQPSETPPPFTLADLEPDNAELPLTAVSWVTDCADEAFGMQVRVEDANAVLIRRLASKHTSPTFRTDDPAIIRLFPDLEQYPGTVQFHPMLTKTVYRAYDKARQMLDKYPANDIENTFLLRQFRAAIPLVKDWDVPGVPWSVVKNGHGEGLPLVLASFLVESADTFLSKRINLKKLRGSAGISFR